MSSEATPEIVSAFYVSPNVAPFCFTLFRQQETGALGAQRRSTKNPRPGPKDLAHCLGSTMAAAIWRTYPNWPGATHSAGTVGSFVAQGLGVAGRAL